MESSIAQVQVFKGGSVPVVAADIAKQSKEAGQDLGSMSTW